MAHRLLPYPFMEDDVRIKPAVAVVFDSHRILGCSLQSRSLDVCLSSRLACAKQPQVRLRLRTSARCSVFVGVESGRPSDGLSQTCTN